MSDETVTPSSGNVFADMGMDRAELRLAIAEAMIAIRKTVDTSALGYETIHEVLRNKLLRAPFIDEATREPIASPEEVAVRARISQLSYRLGVKVALQGMSSEGGIFGWARVTNADQWRDFEFVEIENEEGYERIYSLHPNEDGWRPAILAFVEKAP